MTGRTYHGWNIVGVCVLSQIAANGLTYNTFSLFVADWSHDLHTPVSTLMLCIAAMIWVAAAVSPFIGTLADRVPARRLFAIGLCGIALFYALVGLTTAGWQVVALYALLCAPALTLCTAVPANAVISRWFVRRLGLALGLSAFGIGLGGVIIPPLVAIVLPAYGWRTVWIGGAVVLMLVVLPIVLAVLRDRPAPEEADWYLDGDGAAASTSGHGHAARATGSLITRDVLSRRNFLLLVGIYIPMVGVSGACVQNIAPIAASQGLDAQAAGVLLAIASVAHIVATLLAGLLCDRFGARVPLIGLTAIVAIGAALIALAPHGGSLAVAVFLVGLGSGVITPLAAAIAAEFGPQDFGRAFGLVMLFLPLASPFAFVLARTEEVTGHYAPALFGFAATALAATVFALLMRAPRGAAPALTPAV